LVAKWLGLVQKHRPLKKLRDFDVDFSNDIKSVMTEIDVTDKMLANGRKLMDMTFPDKTLVVMVKRDQRYFVPTGKTVLNENDKILIITDNHEALIETYKSLGIEDI